MRVSTFLLSLSVAVLAVHAIDLPVPANDKLDAAHLKRNIHVHRRETNAHRLSRGLAPLKPRMSRTRAEDPSRVVARQNPSSSAVCKTGHIKVVDANNPDSPAGDMGYISDKYSSESTNANYHRFGTTPSMDEADWLSVTFTTNPSSEPFEIFMNNAPYESNVMNSDQYVYLGYTKGFRSNGYDLDDSTNSENFLVLTGVATSNEPGVPEHRGNAYHSTYLSESFIWNYDASNDRLIPTWINVDGHAAIADMVYYPAKDSLRLTGNFDANEATYTGTKQVYFVLEGMTCSSIASESIEDVDTVMESVDNIEDMAM